jgi:uncharacterized protein (TIGR02757 family)
MHEKELKEFLDFKAAQYESANFIETDPISIPHQFIQKEDIEIAALLVSTIAWGNRKSIIKSGENLMHIMGQSPYEFVMEYNSKQKKKLHFVHRTFNSDDLDFFFRALQNMYKNDGLENAFSKHKTIEGVQGRIVNFRTTFLNTKHEARSTKHISDPLNNSAAKRLNMFLRWMVRSPKKGVDFGIWKSISPSELHIPLDVHTGNIARKLELLNRKQNDWKALEELMKPLQKFDKKDPVKYDFALFGLGAFEKF